METPPGHRAIALRILAAGIGAAVLLTVAIAVSRPSAETPPKPTPSQPDATVPIVPSEPAATPTPLSGAISTITAPGPFILEQTDALADGSIAFLALTYVGKPAGSLLIPYSLDGWSVSPDGSKVLDGDRIFSVDGTTLGTITSTTTNPPVWADDSDHLCGISDDLRNEGETQLLVFDTSGAARTVAMLGPGSQTTSWDLAACSVLTDRVVLFRSDDDNAAVTNQTMNVLRLSTGTSLISRVVAAWPGVVSHDGRIVAVNESSGVVIRSVSTWAVLGSVVRWGSQEGSPLIGAATVISWDGSRILIDGGGAGGAEHPEWIVDWASGRNVITSVENPSILGLDPAAIPLTQGSELFLYGVSGVVYLMNDAGALRKVS